MQIIAQLDTLVSAIILHYWVLRTRLSFSGANCRVCRLVRTWSWRWRCSSKLGCASVSVTMSDCRVNNGETTLPWPVIGKFHFIAISAFSTFLVLHQALWSNSGEKDGRGGVVGQDYNEPDVVDYLAHHGLATLVQPQEIAPPAKTVQLAFNWQCSLWVIIVVCGSLLYH